MLTRYQQFTRLYMVAFGEIQQQVMLAVPPPLRVVIYRRLMLRIAQGIAEKAHAGALVTGEVIGQVASQTLENMATIGSVSTLPVFRPLIGMDKDEITAEAQRLGTYPISIIEDQDCCQLFTPKHPATKARRDDIEAAERALPIDDFVRQAVESAVVEDFNYPGAKIAAFLAEGHHGSSKYRFEDRRNSRRRSGQPASVSVQDHPEGDAASPRARITSSASTACPTGRRAC